MHCGHGELYECGGQFMDREINEGFKILYSLSWQVRRQGYSWCLCNQWAGVDGCQPIFLRDRKELLRLSLRIRSGFILAYTALQAGKGVTPLKCHRWEAAAVLLGRVKNPISGPRRCNGHSSSGCPSHEWPCPREAPFIGCFTLHLIGFWHFHGLILPSQWKKRGERVVVSDGILSTFSKSNHVSIFEWKLLLTPLTSQSTADLKDE